MVSAGDEGRQLGQFSDALDHVVRLVGLEQG